jgi:hypothetical protein
MKKMSALAAGLFFTALSILFTACKSEEAKNEPVAENASAPAPEAVNTIVTTPELMCMIKHKVKDYAAWKIVYDSDDSARRANGLQSYVLGRGADDSLMVMVAMKVDNLDKAKAYAKTPWLKAKMQQGGVVGAPEISFVNVLWQDTVNVGNIPRVITTYTVNDWDTWKKVFEEGKQARMENGIVDRNYGHDADDNKKVSTVTALTDVEKAKAHWASDAIKKRIEAGGITSPLNRFVFNIVQRY